MGKLHINLLGTSFTIQASEDTEYLTKLLGYYERITKDVSKINSVKTPLQTSILSGIMLCDELYKEKTKSAELAKANSSNAGRNNNDESGEKSRSDEEVKKRTLEMIDKISKVL